MADSRCKYYKQKKQVSYDNGVTWYDVIPYEYQKGELYEMESQDCGYVPPVKQYRWVRTDETTCVFTTKKLVATYTGGTTREVVCNGNATLTSSETQPSNYDASAMTSAVIGDCVTSIGMEAFWYCSGLTSVTISDSVTSIGNSAFRDCSSLTSITIPDSVTSIDALAFHNCSGLTSCTIGSGVTSIGSAAFECCSGLTNINIPNGVTSIGDGAFSWCSSLTSVTIPEGVISIDYLTFSRCSSLTSVTIPNSVTSIGDYAFRYCYSLTSINIPSGVTSIGDYAFEYCSGLTSVTVEATTPPRLGDNVFDNTNNCPIYVPASALETYKTASTRWSNYAFRIQPIP